MAYDWVKTLSKQGNHKFAISLFINLLLFISFDVVWSEELNLTTRLMFKEQDPMLTWNNIKIFDNVLKR